VISFSPVRDSGRAFLFDLRALRLKERRARLRKALRGANKALGFREHLEGDGEAIFRHACSLGLEGIVSKRRDTRYRSGRSLAWLKIKNPDLQAPGWNKDGRKTQP
jgi:ATP-dependent DNA ligase